MKSFLRQCAEHYFPQDGFEHTCFIFPNRRSEVFFRHHVKDLAAERNITMLCPPLRTINDFLFETAKRKPSDKVHLLISLYECYRTLNPKAEPLDDFLFWGDVVLGDFDDADKYLANPEHLFTNVAQFKNMQDSLDYLTPEQESAVKDFIRHFKTGGHIKDEFLRLWDILLPLYKLFNDRLKKDGISYEGAVYREVAESEESIKDILSGSFPDCPKFVFIGLNALSQCEIKILSRMQKAGLAEFCWDYCGQWIKSKENKSSMFLSDFTLRFPSAFTPDESGLPETRFRAISVPSATGQAKLLPSLLREIDNPGINTAIVIPDENLLIPVLNSIPEQISELNVTMGYPMKSSAVWVLMSGIAQLQLRRRERNGQIEFYHKNVTAILSSSIIKSIAEDKDFEGYEALRDTLDNYGKDAKYYMPESSFAGVPLLDLIFRGIPTDDIAALEDYQQTILLAVAERLKKMETMSLELEFVKDYYMAVGRLRSCGIDVKMSSYFRLLDSLVGGKSIPFKGEPLNGLQIMGPLETRALDFENVIILGCNEGVFPAHRVSSSLIPPELRRGFGLPTYEFQDAVWAYYFYRLIHRAANVVMVYDSRADGKNSGEESRYIKQLELDFGAKMERSIADSRIILSKQEETIAKTEDHIEKLHGRNLSATAIQDYLSCPVKFYFKYICMLKADDQIKESLDAGMLGNVFHKTMQDLYKGRKRISKADLEALLKDRKRIAETAKVHIREEMKAGKDEPVCGKNLLFLKMVEKYVLKVLARDKELLETYGTDSFTVEGIEKPVSAVIDGFNFYGKIDRLDSFAPDELRIVDYKTGAVSDQDFIINEGNAEETVRNLFDPDSKNRPKIALQLYLYDRFVQEENISGGRRILNSIYQTGRLFVKNVENVELCGKFQDLMKKALSNCLAEISDTAVEWKRNDRSCEWCDFKDICGR